MRNRTRYLIVMALSVVLNIALYSLASHFGLPVWMDITGTVFAAIVLEPAAGLLVGLANNFYLALFVFDRTTLIYYVVSAAAALIAGVLLKKSGKLRWQRIFPTIVLVIVASAILSTAVTVWRDGGIPTAQWEIHFYNWAIQSLHAPRIPACFFGIFVMKIFDTLAVAVIVAFLYAVLPKKLKYPRDELIKKQMA